MNAPPRKCSFRISLRTLAVLVTALCVVLGWKVRQVERQKEVVAWVEQQGNIGRVWYDYELSDAGDLIVDAKLPGPQWLRDLVGVDYFATVTGVRFTEIEVADILPLADLQSLKCLHIIGASAIDLSPISNLMQLQQVSLVLTHVSDLSPLEKLPNLKTLWLDGTDVSRDEVSRFQNTMPNCRICSSYSR